jgi:membrane AbrB-like protein
MAVIACATAAAFGLKLGSIPAWSLLGPFVVGIAYAFVPGPRLRVPVRLDTSAQVVIGVTIGTFARRETLTSVGSHWLPVVVVSVGSLGLSLLAGWILARFKSIDLVTAALGMFAGGSAGVISIGRELGADERMVALLQYLRLLIIFAITPVIARFAFSGSDSVSHAPAPVTGSALAGLAFLVACGVLGLGAARVVRVPGGALIGPMVLTATITLLAPGIAHAVPADAQNLAFAAIGLQVGLGFTAEIVRQARTLLLLSTLLSIGMIAASALFGLVLARIVGVSARDGYLSTTPGGLSVVLPIATSTSRDVGFVLSIQVIRTFGVLLSAAPLAHVSRWRDSRKPLAQAADVFPGEVT